MEPNLKNLFYRKNPIFYSSNSDFIHFSPPFFIKNNLFFISAGMEKEEYLTKIRNLKKLK